MKTLYSLGGVPQFRLPCVRFNFLLKEREAQFKNLNIFNKKSGVIKDFYNLNNLEGNEKDSKLEHVMEQIFPCRALNKCIQINPSIRIRMKKFYKSLSHSLSLRKKNNKINNNQINNNESSKILFNKKNYESKLSNTIDDDNKKQNDDINNLRQDNEKINKNNDLNNLYDNYQIKIKNGLTNKIYNYNYPLSNNSESNDLDPPLITKYKTEKNEQLKTINDTNDLTTNSNTNYKNSYINYYFKNNKKKFYNSSLNNDSKFNSLSNNNSNSFKNLKLTKSKRNRLNLQKKLNLLYYGSQKEINKKNNKYKSNKVLYRFGLKHIYSSPKIALNKFNSKMNLIENNIGISNNILRNKTFNIKESLGNIDQIHPFIEKLKKNKKEKKYMRLFFSIPFDSINQFKKK